MRSLVRFQLAPPQTPLEIGDRLHEHPLQLFAQVAELIDG